MAKIRYRWKELDLISLTTISNIITFIQFAIIPLDVVNSETQTESGMEKIEKFITLNFGSLSKVFTAPFDFIRGFYSIGAPIRVAISATALFGLFAYLYAIFFLKSWRIILFYLDLFIPGSFLMGILFLARKYKEQRTNAIILIVLGCIYIIARVLIVLLIPPISKFSWYKDCAKKITAIFRNRLNDDQDEEMIKETSEYILDKIKFHEHSIQFTSTTYPFKNRIIDLVITIILWVIMFIFTIVGWRNILRKSFDGAQLRDISLVSNIVTYILFGGICIRLILNLVWLVHKTDKSDNSKKFLIDEFCVKIRVFGYKGLVFLTGIVLLPILKMVLNASATTDIHCGWYQYYDFRSNTESFLQYFMKRDGMGCVNCSKTSANHVYPCNEICYYDPEYYPLYYKVLIDSNQITETELTDVYAIPTVLLEIYYLAVFFLLLRLIYHVILNIIDYLPSPTKMIDCKFQTLVTSLKSAGVHQFRSYRYKSSLYYFSFTQSKLFVLFLTSLITVIPIKFIKANSQRIIPWIFFLACIIIASSQISREFSPYVSRLHNIVNIVSYFVGGFASLLVGFHVCEIFTIPSFLGNLIMILIVAAPIVTALITPFFAEADRTVSATKFELKYLQIRDDYLDDLMRKKLENGESFDKMGGCKDIDDPELQDKAQKEDELSVSDDGEKKWCKMCRNVDESTDENTDDDDDNTAKGGCTACSKKKNKKKKKKFNDDEIDNFNLMKLAPIHVIEGVKADYNENYDNEDGKKKKINCDCFSCFKNIDNKKYIENSQNIWSYSTITKEKFVFARNEMFVYADKLIDCITYNNIMRLLNLSVIISSACLGWCLGSGIVQWNRVFGPNGNDYYLRCNMFPNGTYPAFGKY